MENKKDWTCKEFIMFATYSKLDYTNKFTNFSENYSFYYKTEAEIWDLFENGIRIFVFPMEQSQFLANAVNTVSLFEPLLSLEVGSYGELLNLEFILNYLGIDMKERKDTVELDESELRSGDIIFAFRLDGLDPILGWGTGTSVGHTAMVVKRDNQVQICES